MKTFHIMLFSLAFLFLSSFSSVEDCNYASSNMNYVKTKTEEALEREDLNSAKFYVFKAIKVLQTSTQRFNDCACVDADDNIEASLVHLKAATKSTSLAGTRILLQEALQQITAAIKAIDSHKMHNKTFESKDFVMNTSIDLENKLPSIEPIESALYRRIDSSLVSYSKSINIVMDSVDCSVAQKFAKNIYLNCEKELLKKNLSEGKKYYNLRTKEITKKALLRLGACGTGK